ncbi:MAG: 4Fe-4S dicluster domain-containing protein, partial [Cocleimonas sp.]|nr:4Fe-4S dicluster domain-containing protein [Cocleimonas sp.]
EVCINCGACIDECPTEAIVDEEDDPRGEEIYYVYPEKCDECVNHYNVLECVKACPVNDCIVWDDLLDGVPSMKNRGIKGETCTI